MRAHYDFAKMKARENFYAKPARKPKRRLDNLLKGVSKQNIHRSVDTGPAVGREVW